MNEWFAKAVSEPWLFISATMAIIIYRAGKVVWRRLFDDDGMVTEFVKSIKADSEEMKLSLVKVAESSSASLHSFQGVVTDSLRESRQAIYKLEEQLVNAIQAKPNDDELFRVLFDDNPIPICFISDDHKFTKVNNSCAEFLGYSTGELAGMTFMEVTAEKDVPADMENVERLRAGTITRYRMEKKYKSKSGIEKGGVLYVFRYPETGAFLHYISIIIPM